MLLTLTGFLKLCQCFFNFMLNEVVINFMFVSSLLELRTESTHALISNLNNLTFANALFSRTLP